ncbi:hypothetical protein CoHVHLJ_108 [Columbid alphaherpesvirus 1]|uniref:Uncharacterized protein n=1 Tax=Columbid alphaherpesvirus 1 TaxID=93386 RepID=A0A1V0M8P1_9ALPH|nr:hypothetical protein CoHVHLJ_108 [Columbid alphaherpesvirus 1]ARD71419.1 hypothetical protein CoHVHLJ_108 [Columbid alphaherpesvirus 1]
MSHEDDRGIVNFGYESDVECTRQPLPQKVGPVCTAPAKEPPARPPGPNIQCVASRDVRRPTAYPRLPRPESPPGIKPRDCPPSLPPKVGRTLQRDNNEEVVCTKPLKKGSTDIQGSGAAQSRPTDPGDRVSPRTSEGTSASGGCGGDGSSTPTAAVDVSIETQQNADGGAIKITILIKGDRQTGLLIPDLKLHRCSCNCNKDIS